MTSEQTHESSWLYFLLEERAEAELSLLFPSLRDKEEKREAAV